MARKAKKTEHSGAKKGRGAFYGRKAEAKKVSTQRRRAHSKDMERGASDDTAGTRRGTT